MSVELKPKNRIQFQSAQRIKIKKRDLRPSSRLIFRKYLELLNIPNMFNNVLTCTEKNILLETMLQSAWTIFFHYAQLKVGAMNLLG